MKEGLITLRDTRIEEGLFVVDNRVFNKGEEFPAHWHDYYELEIITGGRGEHTYNNNKTMYMPGSAFITSYCDYHSYKFLETTSLINVSFDESRLPSSLVGFISAGISKCNCIFSPEELEVVVSLAKSLKKETESGNAFREEMISSILTDIVIRIIRSSEADVDGGISTLVQKAVSVIHNYFRKQISLHETAEMLHVSSNYLGIKFKNSMGMSFKSYLNMIRLRYCCNLLSGTSLSVKEIAYSGGYTSLEYFLQVFKKTLGITPTEYRSKNRVKGGGKE